jgi:hypothetical protein
MCCVLSLGMQIRVLSVFNPWLNIPVYCLFWPSRSRSLCLVRESFHIDSPHNALQNGIMSANSLTAVESQEQADSQAVLDHLLHKRPLDPDVYRRVHERAAKATEELRQKYGTLDIAVDLIRQVRDEG